MTLVTIYTRRPGSLLRGSFSHPLAKRTPSTVPPFHPPPLTRTYSTLGPIISSSHEDPQTPSNTTPTPSSHLPPHNSGRFTSKTPNGLNSPSHPSSSSAFSSASSSSSSSPSSPQETASPPSGMNFNPSSSSSSFSSSSSLPDTPLNAPPPLSPGQRELGDHHAPRALSSFAQTAANLRACLEREIHEEEAARTDKPPPLPLPGGQQKWRVQHSGGHNAIVMTREFVKMKKKNREEDCEKEKKEEACEKESKEESCDKAQDGHRKDKTRGSSEDEKNETELHRVTTAVSRIEPILDTEQGPKPRHYPFVLRIEKTKEYVMELSMDVVEGECIVDDVVVRRRGVNGGSGVEKVGCSGQQTKEGLEATQRLEDSDTIVGERRGSMETVRGGSVSGRSISYEDTTQRGEDNSSDVSGLSSRTTDSLLTPEERQLSFKGPQPLEEMDPKMYDRLQRFLRVRGIDEDFAIFLTQQIAWHEQEEYEAWLRHLGDFIS